MTEQERKLQTIQWIVTGIALILGLYNQCAINQGWPHIEIGDAELTKYVTWLYEAAVGIYAFWNNNNVTSDAKLSQLVLNGLKDKKITPAQVEDLINSDTLKIVADKLREDETLGNQIEAFLANDEMREVCQAHLDGKTVDVEITEG